jgi:hypothetical protein
MYVVWACRLFYGIVLLFGLDSILGMADIWNELTIFKQFIFITNRGSEF